jgi:hypothetical protein
MSERKLGFRERLGSAFKLGLGKIPKERDLSPAPSFASSFISRDVHAHAQVLIRTPDEERAGMPDSGGLFPFAQPSSRASFITPAPSPSRLSRLELGPLDTTPMPRRTSTLELPADTGAQDCVRSRYGAAICPLSPDPTAQLMNLVARSGALTPPPEARCSRTTFGHDMAEALDIAPNDAGGRLPRKDELFAFESAHGARKGSFPFQAARQRSLGELDLMFSPRRTGTPAAPGDEDDEDEWRSGARERWECETIELDESRRSSFLMLDDSGSTSGSGGADLRALALDLDLSRVPVHSAFVDPWARGQDHSDAGTLASSVGTEEDSSSSSIWNWPVPPSETHPFGSTAKAAEFGVSACCHQPDRVLTWTTSQDRVKPQSTPLAPLRRSVSLDSPRQLQPLSGTDRLSCNSAYFSARSRPSTAGTTWSARELVGRNKPLPPAPADASADQDDSGVFVGDISVAPLL